MNSKTYFLFAPIVAFLICTHAFCPKPLGILKPSHISGTPGKLAHISGATAKVLQRRENIAKKDTLAADWKKSNEHFDTGMATRFPAIPISRPKSSTELKTPLKLKPMLRSRTEERLLPPDSARSDSSIESIKTLSPRGTDERFLKIIRASGTGEIPGGRKNHKERFKKRLASKVPASELNTRVAAHMEKAQIVSEQSRAALAKATSINTTGMSQADLAGHEANLTREFGENAFAAINRLRLAKKKSSPEGWYPGAPR